jgi:hypothetical protein
MHLALYAVETLKCDLGVVRSRMARAQQRQMVARGLVVRVISHRWWLVSVVPQFFVDVGPRGANQGKSLLHEVFRSPRVA